MVKSKALESFTDSNGRRWLNSSVAELMKKRAEAGETPHDTIRRLSRRMVAEAKTLGWTEVPFDPEILAELQGIEVTPASVDIRAEARLMPLPNNRLQIEYRPDAPERRRRFSICHEIAHTLFPDCFECVQHRRTGQKHDPVHAELEQLCHLGAGELLMPLDDFLEAAKDRRICFQTADDIGRIFNASQEASLRRMVDLSGDKICLVWASERLKPTEERSAGPEWDFGFEAPKPKLRVDYQFNSAKWEKFIPKHKSLPDGSLLYSVLRSEAYEKAIEEWHDLKLGQIEWEAVGSMHGGPDASGVMILLREVR